MPEIERPRSTPPLKKFRPYRLLSEEESTSLRRKRKALKGFITTVLALAVLAWGYVYYHSFFEDTRDAKVFTNTVPLAAKVAGKVEKVFVKESQAVKAGDPILQVEQRTFQATLDQRQRELDRLEDRLEGGRAHLGKLQEKVASGGDPARKAYEDARAWYGREQKKAQELRVSVNEAKAQLSATVITAPADGHVAEKKVDVGANIAEGQPVFNFVGAGVPWVVANFKEVQLEKMKVGQEASISISGLNKDFTGKVESLPQDVTNPYAGMPRLRKLIARFVLNAGERVPVRIAFDAKSVEKDVRRVVNGSAAEVKVYVK